MFVQWWEICLCFLWRGQEDIFLATIFGIETRHWSPNLSTSIWKDTIADFYTRKGTSALFFVFFLHPHCILLHIILEDFWEWMPWRSTNWSWPLKLKIQEKTHIKVARNWSQRLWVTIRTERGRSLSSWTGNGEETSPPNLMSQLFPLSAPAVLYLTKGKPGNTFSKDCLFAMDCSSAIISIWVCWGGGSLQPVGSKREKQRLVDPQEQSAWWMNESLDL